MSVPDGIMGKLNPYTHKVIIEWPSDGDRREYLFEGELQAGAFIKGFQTGAEAYAGDGYVIKVKLIK